MKLVARSNGNILNSSKDEQEAKELLEEILKIDCKLPTIGFTTEYADVFYTYKNYSIPMIMNILSNGNYNEKIKSKLLDKSYLEKCLNLLAIEGVVVVNDVIDGDNTYQLVPIVLRGSRFIRNYMNIEANNADKILVISDTHIGDKEHEDFNLINEVFDYARKREVKTIIHLGDVFHGLRLDKGKFEGYNYNSSEVKEELESQIKSFVDFFPDDIKVIAIAGNHDNSIIDYIWNNYKLESYYPIPINQYYLSLLKPNFHLLKEREQGYTIDLSNMRIVISHAPRFNMFFRYVKTNQLDADDSFMSIFKDVNDEHIDLCLSGHYHNSVSRVINDRNGTTRRIIEVVPSLSKLSNETEDNSIAKFIRFIRDEYDNVTHYGITTLYNKNHSIIEGEEIIYQTNNELLKENKLTLKGIK